MMMLQMQFGSVQVRAFLEAEGYGDIVAVQRKCFCEVSGREILEKARRVSHCIKIDPRSSLQCKPTSG